MTIFVEFFENFKIVFMMKCMNCLCVMVLFGALTACSEKPQNVLTEEEKAAGWQLLFDGQTLEGWRDYNGQALTGPWEVVDDTTH